MDLRSNRNKVSIVPAWDRIKSEGDTRSDFRLGRLRTELVSTDASNVHTNIYGRHLEYSRKTILDRLQEHGHTTYTGVVDADWLGYFRTLTAEANIDDIFESAVTPDTNCIIFKAKNAGSLMYHASSVAHAEYSLDGGLNWAPADGVVIDFEPGQSIRFRASVTGPQTEDDHASFEMTGGPFELDGNISAMAVPDATTAVPDYAFYGLFEDCVRLTVAPSINIKTASPHCFDSTFKGCTNLTVAPQISTSTLADSCFKECFKDCTTLQRAGSLPAKVCAPNCYESMYENCGSLRVAPALPANTLAPSCYQAMFKSSGVQTAPQLKATTLEANCYDSMFADCGNLQVGPTLWAQNPVEYCYQNMFADCVNLKELTVYSPSAGQDIHATDGMFTNIHTDGILYAPNGSVDWRDVIPEEWVIEQPLTYMKFTATGADMEIGYNAGSTLNTVEYSTDGVMFMPLTATKITVPNGSTILVRGNVNTAGTETNHAKFEFEGAGSISAIGSLMSLYKRNPEDTDIITSGAFYGLFEGCSQLVSAPELTAEGLSSDCYNSLFAGCSSLQQAPSLPAEALSAGCYANMFAGSGITTMPELNSTMLDTDCYSGMFSNCQGLVDVIELPATSIPQGAYSQMFAGCTNIGKVGHTIPQLPATTVGAYGYQEMFAGCTGIIEAPVLRGLALAEGSYEGMFAGCTHITTPPYLQANTLHPYVYAHMFEGCEMLGTTGLLNAVTMAEHCYDSMFKGCTTLFTSEDIKATTLAEGCFQDMFADCINLGVPVALPVDQLEPHCYDGMFRNTGIEGGVTLPATKLAESCYENMFRGSRLTHVATLPDALTALKPSCFKSMYEDCQIPTVADTYLPFENLQPSCYERMFANNLVLVKAPTLPALELVEDCYKEMFDMPDTQTALLDEITILAKDPHDASGNIAASYMFGCDETEEHQYIITHGVMHAPNGNDSGWENIVPKTWRIEIPGLKLIACEDNCSFIYNPSSKSSLSYTTDGKEWQTAVAGEVIELPLTGDEATLVGTVAAGQSETDFANFVLTGKIRCEGSAMPLLGLSMDAKELSVANCFYGLFKDCATLQNMPELPATTLSNGCYAHMFEGCTSLTESVDLPATTLNSNCYQSMFEGCTGLTKIPQLNATFLAPYCYQAMFKDVNVQIPATFELNATALGSYCYANMFENNTVNTRCPNLPAVAVPSHAYDSMFKGNANLNAVGTLKGASLGTYCYTSMFEDCTNLRKTPDLIAQNAASHCYDSMFKNAGIIQLGSFNMANTAEYCCAHMFEGCASLTTSYTLPANTAAHCYESMYEGTGLVTAPELPATVLQAACYQAMFKDCASLVNGSMSGKIVLPAENLTEDCYKDMFHGCEKIDEITINAKDSWGGTAATSKYADNMFGAVVSGEGHIPTTGTCHTPNGSIGWGMIIPIGWHLDDPHCGLKFNSTATSDPATITFSVAAGMSPDAEYTIDDGIHWVVADNVEVTVPDQMTAPKFVRYRANAVAQTIDEHTQFVHEGGDLTCEGNITSMYDKSDTTTVFSVDYCFAGMFEDVTGVDFSLLKLPAETMSQGCYARMFKGCTDLTVMPALTASTLADHCYEEMFMNSGITTRPTLPAMTMAAYCYKSMFEGCASLAAAPELKAKNTLAEGCYQYMFKDCTTITSTGTLPTDVMLPDYAYNGMFQGCTSLASAESMLAKTVGLSSCESMYEGCTSLTRMPTFMTMNVADACFKAMFKDCTSLAYTMTLIPTTMKPSCYESMFENTALTSIATVSANTLDEACFKAMYKDCANLTNIPEFKIEAMKPSCYESMFDGCSSLVNIPDLKATVLATACFKRMFAGTAITTMPLLQLTDLAESCYEEMFDGCVKLTDLQETSTQLALPATTLAPRCYYGMFRNCAEGPEETATGLVTGPHLPAIELADQCYENMFQGCNALMEVHVNVVEPNDLACLNMFGDPGEKDESGTTTREPDIPTHGTLYADKGNINWEKYAPLYWEIVWPIFKFVATEDVTVTYHKSATANAEYSYNGKDWYPADGVAINLVFGDKDHDEAMFRGKVTGPQDPDAACAHFDTTAPVQVKGSLMDLYDKDGESTTINKAAAFAHLFEGTQITTYPEIPVSMEIGDSAFEAMFKDCTELTELPESLPEELTNSCFKDMFNGCTGITSIPADYLPATTLQEHCYDSMFANTGITEVPELPATELARFCYKSMFEGCASLATLVDIAHVELLAESCFEAMYKGTAIVTIDDDYLNFEELYPACYKSMFEDCDSLNSVPLDLLPATWLPGSCYEAMFKGCDTLEYAPLIPNVESASAGAVREMFMDCVSMTQATVMSKVPFTGFIDTFKNIATDGVLHALNCDDPADWPADGNTCATTWVIDRPLRFESEGPATITVSASSKQQVEYTTDGMEWLPVSGGIAIFKDHPVYFRANITGNLTAPGAAFSSTAPVSVLGSLMSMHNNKSWSDTIEYDGAFWGMFKPLADKMLTTPDMTAITLTAHCYESLYEGCSSLTDAPELLSADAPEACYKNMFKGCTSLTATPDMNATEISDSSYYGMFEGCTSLTATNDFTAVTSVGESGCQNMFKDCTSLIEASELKALELSDKCYMQMFMGCTSLAEVPNSMLPVGDDILDPTEHALKTNCYAAMFQNCTLLEHAPDLPSRDLANGCYQLMFAGCTSLVDAHVACADPEPGNSPLMFQGVHTDGILFARNGNDSWNDIIPEEWRIHAPLLFKATAASTVKYVQNSGLTVAEYSTDDGRTWDTGVVNLDTNKRVIYRGTVTGTQDPEGTPAHFEMTGNLKSNGFVTSLLSNGDIEDIPVATASCFTGLFKNCTSLQNAPELPSDTIASHSYSHMFEGCTSITKVPELPVESVAEHAYDSMFKGCNHISTVPVDYLPATTLEEGCYKSMFEGCQSLTVAPKLPATTMEKDCYNSMFKTCAALTAQPVVSATTSAEGCFCSMFEATGVSTATAIPVTEFAKSSCERMFADCDSLVSTPVVSVETAAEAAFKEAFAGCTNLVSGASLTVQATSVGKSAFEGCFFGDTTLVTAPNMANATAVADSCYKSMFEGCTALTNFGTLPAETLAVDCYARMFADATALVECTVGAHDPEDFTPDMFLNIATEGILHVPECCDATKWFPVIPETWMTDPEPCELFFKAVEPSTITHVPSASATAKYITPGHDWTNAATTVSVDTGKRVWYNGKVTSFQDPDAAAHFTMTGGLQAGGSIASLYNENAHDPAIEFNYAFAGLFKDCTALRVAPELPTPTLVTGCYQSLFEGCTSLTTAPQLVATALAPSCYKNMFKDCTALINLSNFVSTEAPANCFESMFQGCTALETAPTLPATTLSKESYKNMFKDCTALVSIANISATALAEASLESMYEGCTAMTATPALTVQTVGKNSMHNMFKGCSQLATNNVVISADTMAQSACESMYEDCIVLTTYPSLPATTLAVGCYKAMFKGCTSITSFGNLPAETLVTSCYEEMFSGATALTSVKVMAPDDSNFCTDMFKDIHTTGILHVADASYATNWFPIIPEEWMTDPEPNEFSLCSALEGVAANVTYTKSTVSSAKYIYPGHDWETLTTIELPDTNAKRWFQGQIVADQSEANYSKFAFDSKVTPGNSIMSLYNKKATDTEIVHKYAFAHMFENCENLTVAPTLSATTISEGCYASMFKGSAITIAPALAATVLAPHCYESTFEGCVNLVGVITTEFSTIDVPDYAFSKTFKGCTVLTTVAHFTMNTIGNHSFEECYMDCPAITQAFALPASSVGAFGCKSMFENCTALEVIPSNMLPAMTLGESCYERMFFGCTKLIP